MTKWYSKGSEKSCSWKKKKISDSCVNSAFSKHMLTKEHCLLIWANIFETLVSAFI